MCYGKTTKTAGKCCCSGLTEAIVRADQEKQECQYRAKDDKAHFEYRHIKCRPLLECVRVVHIPNKNIPLYLILTQT